MLMNQPPKLSQTGITGLLKLIYFDPGCGYARSPKTHDEALRSQVNNYFLRRLSKKPTEKERHDAKAATLAAFPQLIEQYIKLQEDNGNQARAVSGEKVLFTERTFVGGLRELLINALFETTPFYEIVRNTKEEARKRVNFLKDVVENKDGYRIFWPNNLPLRTEEDLQILYRLTWCGTTSDINREVNNGRGPVDFKASRGRFDKTLIEFKLASNTSLKKNLANQVEIYQKANDTSRALKVITFFRDEELTKISAILAELALSSCEDIILIDARQDNKPSASKATVH
jgi:hypothetical protein